MEYLFLAEIIRIIPIKAPIQKEKAKAQMPPQKPKSQGIPRANLASPRPIHLPFETSHKEPKKAKKARPIKKAES